MSVSIINDRSAQLVMAVDGVGYDEARGRLERAALVVEADPDLDAAHQSALLAAVVCAVRMFNGGVFIDPTLTGRFTIGHERRRPLRAALEELGASSVTAPDHAVRLRIGWRQGDRPADLQAWCDGWSAVIGPTGTDAGPSASNVLCGVAAGGLAAAELFRRAVLDDILACKWRQRLDVWGPGDPPSDAALRKLPRQIWLLGLGNLGQASLFTLALLPWADTAEVSLVLNDVDTVGPENLAVQVLTTHAWVGQKKARAAAAWAEARGFKTIIEERRFTPATRPFGDEPALALVGVDNLEARRCAAEAGFGLVIDAGLGATGPEAFDIRLHSFPGAQTAQMAWPDTADLAVRPVSDGLAALVAQGRLDPCGAMTIAGTSVGAPCTAMVAAALQVAQACRALETGFCADRIDLSLADLRHAAWRLMAAAPPHLPTTLNGLSQA